MNKNSFDTAWRDHLQGLDSAGLRRRLRDIQARRPGHVTIDGRELLNFSSNDYLGLSQHPALIERGSEWAARWGAGSAASRLVCGNLAPFEEVEAKIAAAKGSESALTMASGWQTNAAVIAALLDAKVLGGAPLVFADRLNHASMHAGCAAAGARQIRYRHNDLEHLRELLETHRAEAGKRFILTESVFSMDGDRADIAALVEIAEQHDAFLYVDEAHATGALGEHGFGLCEGIAGRIGLVMGTFSKAMGGFGAYVACSHALRDYLINRASGFIYSTALPAFVLGAMDAALDLVPSLGSERGRLAANAERFRAALRQAGLDCGASTTQIVPLILGGEAETLAAAKRLEEDGILAIAIRPPTVPSGSSRLRFALTAAHTDRDVDRLIDSVTRVCAR